MEDSRPKVDLSRFGIDLTDPASVMTLLESTELTEDEMEFLLEEAIRVNKNLKEQLSKEEEDPGAGGEGGRSTSDGDSDFSSRGSSATSQSSGSSSAFGTYSVLPPIKNTDQKPSRKGPRH
ncbi:Hypp1162 [Branchiostoma lanceolatum]|uniref:Hypp1162 protein n=1 Tax=Branchiostoma lanceolatum TaxID=7740 RepID=A0A8K0EJ67_BRALA|nr:Hypp1162 [Branchiostoma lanceolatum]